MTSRAKSSIERSTRALLSAGALCSSRQLPVEPRARPLIGSLSRADSHASGMGQVEVGTCRHRRARSEIRLAVPLTSLPEHGDQAIHHCWLAEDGTEESAAVGHGEVAD